MVNAGRMLSLLGLFILSAIDQNDKPSVPGRIKQVGCIGGRVRMAQPWNKQTLWFIGYRSLED